MHYINLDWAKIHGVKHYTDIINKPDSVSFIATKDTKAIGFLGGYHIASETNTAKTAVLQSMYIKPEHRNQGAGTRLIQRFTEWAKHKQADRIKVTAYTENKSAIRFYRGNRFNDWELTLTRDLKDS